MSVQACHATPGQLCNLKAVVLLCKAMFKCRLVLPACLQVPKLCTLVAQLLQLLGRPLGVMHSLLQDCSNTLFLFSLGAGQLVHVQSLRRSNTCCHQMKLATC